MEIKFSKYTAEEYDNYKKLQDKIEEEGKRVLFEEVFDLSELRGIYFKPYIENIYDHFEDFYKEISYRALNTVTYSYLKDLPILQPKEMFKEQLRDFYEKERAEYFRVLKCKAMYFNWNRDLIYTNLSNEEKSCLKELLPDEMFVEDEKGVKGKNKEQK